MKSYVHCKKYLESIVSEKLYGAGQNYHLYENTKCDQKFNRLCSWRSADLVNCYKRNSKLLSVIDGCDKWIKVSMPSWLSRQDSLYVRNCNSLFSKICSKRKSSTTDFLQCPFKKKSELSKIPGCFERKSTRFDKESTWRTGMIISLKRDCKQRAQSLCPRLDHVCIQNNIKELSKIRNCAKYSKNIKDDIWVNN